MAHSLLPLSIVLDSFFFIDVVACAMSKTVQYLSFVFTFVCPCVLTLSGYLVFLEFTFVLCTIAPLEYTLAVEETVSEFSLVFMAILELTSSLSMEDFANL